MFHKPHTSDSVTRFLPNPLPDEPSLKHHLSLPSYKSELGRFFDSVDEQLFSSYFVL